MFVLNFSTSNVQTNCYKSISQKFGKILNNFAFIFLILVICQLNTFCIPVFLSVTFTMVVTLIFILLIALSFNMYIKLTSIIGIFIDFLIRICIIFCVSFLEFIIFSRLLVFFYLTISLLLYAFVNILHLSCLLFTYSIIIYHQVLLFFVFILILTKMLTTFKVIITIL